MKIKVNHADGEFETTASDALAMHYGLRQFWDDHEFEDTESKAQGTADLVLKLVDILMERGVLKPSDIEPLMYDGAEETYDYLDGKELRPLEEHIKELREERNTRTESDS